MYSVALLIVLGVGGLIGGLAGVIARHRAPGILLSLVFGAAATFGLVRFVLFELVDLYFSSPEVTLAAYSFVGAVIVAIPILLTRRAEPADRGSAYQPPSGVYYSQPGAPPYGAYAPMPASLPSGRPSGVPTAIVFLGLALVIGAIIWWAIYYSRVMDTLGASRADLTDALLCLVADDSTCRSVIRAVRSKGLGTPYNPAVIWAGGALLVGGILARISAPRRVD